MKPVHTSEPLAVMLFISLMLHTVVIAAVQFKMPTPVPPKAQTMEVMLVQKKTADTADDEEADFLAQASHEGGGITDTKNRPATPMEAPFPDVSANLVATPPPQRIAAASLTVQTEQLLTDLLSPVMQAIQPKITLTEAPQQADGEAQTDAEAESLPATDLIMNTHTAIASIQAELDEKLDAYSKRPRKEYISARTKESIFASYMEDWRIKMELVGTENYPQSALQQGITGDLVLEVAINTDGTIYQATIFRSSGYKVLDDAALRIVHLSAPFPPFSKEMRKKADLLYITRNLAFKQGHRSLLVD